MPVSVKAVAVFCGSRFGNDPSYRQVAQDAGQLLAQKGIRLVYGGGSHGLMGVVADATLRAGGNVTGVIPHFLHTREKMHEGVAELIVVDSMHVRKQIMFSRADAFWILPGGFGTFDEMMEILTWKQLQRHAKPIIIVNTAGWANQVIAMLDAAEAQGFATASARGKIEIVKDVAEALEHSLSEATATPPLSVDQL
ncbi:TIGR00730 family Rossman fold protein [Acetobacter orientalis]|uniref:Cytokinin riboside 5'-monophosphate phosphoribohydrolase n=1 Tax=Acetobacter orientalis TaxID=146474 RepID=A0A2Z5ZIP8_9PROT|nr:TIGR00730 family Rossman fold protein [Acetobacter orientalis]MCP1215306.1 TIGR00730 family Rossman fold protein [Acetobacter orientalis]MCP1218889.1 TIGR00730 family Rossman fold protein [Acetobacter orientalis]MCP1221916.1 TIGR00730 family Rossman fold protein [Acetobacter orientalis]BBC80373.1 Rossman fold protein, TIGR00730 family [Acetobacter orientalis]GAN65768.1 lysine decarboxylase [Acetobacter orientalis]